MPLGVLREEMELEVREGSKEILDASADAEPDASRIKAARPLHELFATQAEARARALTEAITGAKRVTGLGVFHAHQSHRDQMPLSRTR